MLVVIRKSAAHAGFTLVELLLVIGIISLLIGILLPALNRARESAMTIACLSDVRQIGTAAHLRAGETQGYLPLAGLIRVPNDGSSLPVKLNDSQRQRYAYIDQAGFPLGGGLKERITPLPVALLPYLGSSDFAPTNDALTDIEQITELHTGLELVECPDVSDATRLNTWESVRYGSAESLRLYSNRWDFVANEAVVGFDHRHPHGTARARGQLSRIVNPSQTVLLGEADRLSLSPNIGLLFTWQPTIDPIDSPVTLRDLHEKTGRVNTFAPLDPFRHRGRANILFVDGHVESVPIEPGALEKVILRSP